MYRCPVPHVSSTCVCVCDVLAAIERAMAYIDTGELPWDMDLFDRSSNSEVRVVGMRG